MTTSPLNMNGHEELVDLGDIGTDRPLLRVIDDGHTSTDDLSDRLVIDLQAVAVRLRAAARKASSLEELQGGEVFHPSQGAIARARRALGEAIDLLPDAPSRRVIQVGGLEIVPAARIARFNARTLDLSRAEFDLLLYLARDPIAVCTKEVILKDVWGFRSAGRTRTVESHASRLRNKIVRAGAEPDRFVISCWGIGYALVRG